MPDRRKTQWSQLRVGVLIIVALSAVAALAILLSGKTGVFSTGKISVRAYFRNASGLKVGAPVSLDGVTVGTVRAIHIVAHPALTPVEVVMAIDAKHRKALLSDSRANLQTIGVLGNTVVEIDNLHAQGQPVRNNAVLSTGGNPTLQNTLRHFQHTTQKLNTVVGEVNVLGNNLSSNKGSLGKFVNDPTFRSRTAATMNQFISITKQVSEGKGTVGKFMKDDSLTNHLKDTAAKLHDITTEIDSGKGTVGKFIKDPLLGKNLKDASQQLHQISVEVHSGNGAVGMMLKNAAFRKELHHTGSQLNSILAQTKAGKGTIGKFMKDRSLKNHLNELTVNSRQLFTAMRKHPRKYFAFRFRIF